MVRIQIGWKVPGRSVVESIYDVFFCDMTGRRIWTRERFSCACGTRTRQSSESVGEHAQMRQDSLGGM